ncbi:MAG: cyclic nucleotide-binding domain-containing protein [Pseudomonadota bacterium]
MLAFGSQKLSFSVGARIFHEGQPTDGGFVVISGEIELLQARNGMEIVVDVYRSGDLIGEMAVLTSNKRVGTAVVVEDCQLMKITRSAMHRILEEYPELAYGLQKKITDSVTSFSRGLEPVGKKMRRSDNS